MTRGIANELTGRKFGHLLVLSRSVSDRQGNARWLCKCDCGNRAVVRASFLIKQQKVCSKSCRFNPAKKIKDISGKRFGNLTAIKYVGLKHRKALWKFSCTCGAVLICKSDAVLNAGKKSCGKGVHAASYKHGKSGTRAYKSMHYMKYVSAKSGRTPAWLTQKDIDKMANIYAKASKATLDTGIKHEVDHFFPLQGKMVSGLHVPSNLVVVTRKHNRSKNNKHPDDVC